MRFWKILIAGASLAACSSDADEAPPTVVADLRADANRDGEVRFDDSDAEKTAWSAAAGAVFLANIDDDALRCTATADDLSLPACNDAHDDVVNGEDDLLDLAPLKTRPWKDAPKDATARITVAESTAAAASLVRIFFKGGPAIEDWVPVTEETVFSAEQLKAGLELGIEAIDVVRDAAAWDGFVDVQLSVTSKSLGDKTDTVRLRVAPVLTFHHLQDAEQVWVMDDRTSGNDEMRADLAKSCAAAGLPAPTVVKDDDPWMQDIFEAAYASMPGPGGAQHVMRIDYRSANIFGEAKSKYPLRPAGRLVFRLRGKDHAGIQQVDLSHDLDMDSLNSFGNWETVPPYEKDGESFPLGRLLRGRTKSFYPDRSFTTMVDAQGQQPPIDIDTSWLFVGHVDETLSFVKAPTPRGWALMANDPRLAKQMLEEQVAAGRGDLPMFVGKSWYDYETNAETPAEATISEVLANTEVMRASAEAAAEVDAQIAILKEATGLGDDEIIRVPFLHTSTFGKSIAHMPGTVNGLYLSPTRFASPDPHGPLVNGVDIFKKALETPLAQIGITVDWIEDWDGYHVMDGEVHCGTNTTRAIPTAKWWESAR